MKKETKIKIAVIIGLVIIFSWMWFNFNKNLNKEIQYSKAEFSEIKIDSGYSYKDSIDFDVSMDMPSIEEDIFIDDNGDISIGYVPMDDSIEVAIEDNFKRVYLITKTDTLVFTYTERRMKNKKEMK